MDVSHEFANEPASVRAARDFVEGRLRSHGLDDVEARIVVSELATNAVRHAQTPFTVAVDIKPDTSTIRIEVEDGAGVVKIATELASESTGRGLRIVETAATSWGVDLRGEKKAVWIELPAVASS